VYKISSQACTAIGAFRVQKEIFGAKFIWTSAEISIYVIYSKAFR
jgi:hypothetical protein